jgi:hypothetical protein
MWKYFSQSRAANAQNENPTYLLTQTIQNAVIFGQSIISRKSNTGVEKHEIVANLPVCCGVFKKKWTYLITVNTVTIITILIYKIHEKITQYTFLEITQSWL